MLALVMCDIFNGHAADTANISRSGRRSSFYSVPVIGKRWRSAYAYMQDRWTEDGAEETADRKVIHGVHDKVVAIVMKNRQMKINK